MFWLEFHLEKWLEFWLEISCTVNIVKTRVRSCDIIKKEISSNFSSQIQLTANLFLLNWAPGHQRPARDEDEESVEIADFRAEEQTEERIHELSAAGGNFPSSNVPPSSSSSSSSDPATHPEARPDPSPNPLSRALSLHDALPLFPGPRDPQRNPQKEDDPQEFVAGTFKGFEFDQEIGEAEAVKAEAEEAEAEEVQLQ